MHQFIQVQLVEAADIILIDGVERSISARETYFLGQGGQINAPDPGVYLLWLEHDGQTSSRRYDFYDSVIKVL